MTLDLEKDKHVWGCVSEEEGCCHIRHPPTSHPPSPQPPPVHKPHTPPILILNTNLHYKDVITSAMVTRIISLTIVYSTVYSGADQRKQQSSASLAFLGEFSGHRWIPRSKGPVTRKMFPFDVVIMSIHRSSILFISVTQSFCNLQFAESNSISKTPSGPYKGTPSSRLQPLVYHRGTLRKNIKRMGNWAT